MKNIIFDNYDNMIGFSKDVLEYIKLELIRQLKDNIICNVKDLSELIYNIYNNYNSDDLLKITYSEMGGYTIIKLESEEK